MVNCCVIGCKSRSERKCEKISFHTFPKDDFLRNVWIAATGRQNWQPTTYTYICSIHFKAVYFQKKQKKTYLEKFSMPTIAIHDTQVHTERPSTSKTVDVIPMDCQIEADTQVHAEKPSTSKTVDETVKKKDLLHHLLQECIKKCIGIRLFSADYHFTDLTHYSLLLKAICEKYLNVRIHYATKTIKKIILEICTQNLFCLRTVGK